VAQKKKWGVIEEKKQATEWAVVVPSEESARLGLGKPYVRTFPILLSFLLSEHFCINGNNPRLFILLLFQWFQILIHTHLALGSFWVPLPHHFPPVPFLLIHQIAAHG